MAVEEGELAPQCLQLGAVGGWVAGVAPRPQKQAARAVNVKVDAFGGKWRGVVVDGAARIHKVVLDVVDNGLGFWLGGSAGTTEGLATAIGAGAATAAPVEGEVAVEVCAASAAGGTTIVGGGVDAPRQTGFGMK